LGAARQNSHLLDNLWLPNGPDLTSCSAAGHAVSGIVGQKATLAQANGGDVELVVTGTMLYATYETPDGYPAIYDDRAGLFCFARVVDGRFESTGVPVTAPPPAGVQKHAQEAEAVRAAKIAERESAMQTRAASSAARNEPRED
jgi:hypothetical protein